MDALAGLRGPRVDTRSCERRAVVIADVEAMACEVDRVERASRPGGAGLRVTGNWSAGQLMVHVARLIERSMDGFGAAPASERPVPRGVRSVAARAARSRDATLEQEVRATLVGCAMLPGGASAAGAGEVEPPALVWTQDGAAALRTAIVRIREQHPMDKPSPTVGRLTHEEWLRVHLRHAALHFSFILVGRGA